MNAVTKNADAEITAVLQSSLYPGASPQSIGMVLAYCKAAGLDPMQKPVHIVPMWDNKARQTRDVVMPGIGLYRIQANRTGEFAGVSEPEFGPDETALLGGAEITFPAWCKVTVRRLLASGHVAEFTAVERWRENYAVKGGSEKSIAPNAMWSKRPYGQLAKCAEAQALRKAFPELGAMPTAEEMEGRTMDGADDDSFDLSPAISRIVTAEDMDALQAVFTEAWRDSPVSARKTLTAAKDKRKAYLLSQQESVIDGEVVDDAAA